MVVDYNDVDAYAFVVNSYTYTPFGSFYDGELAETVDNPFKFTGQWHDAEIGQYFLRARMYDPAMMRFTSRDPDRGEPLECLTLHKYLYCINEPINNADPSGRIYLNVANALQAAATVYAAGITIAAVGAELNNWELIIAGAYLIEFAPLACQYSASDSGHV